MEKVDREKERMGEKEAGRRDENKHERRFQYVRPRRVRSNGPTERESKKCLRVTASLAIARKRS